jgi:phage host-nuclease inhibitor protein Gam
MRTKDINTVIEQFDALPLEEKELAAGIIRKAYAEAARDELVKRVKTAVRNQKAGKVRKGNVSDLLKDLEP